MYAKFEMKFFCMCESNGTNRHSSTRVRFPATCSCSRRVGYFGEREKVTAGSKCIGDRTSTFVKNC